jgi:hypothetical protein
MEQAEVEQAETSEPSSAFPTLPTYLHVILPPTYMS